MAVLGGGVAGLTAAALLARSGRSVTLFEHHNVAGGCASFYQRGGYRFDVGATVVNGFGERGIHRRIFAALGVDIAATRVDPAMLVHLPDRTVARYGDARWRAERIRAFGDGYEAFWNRQERLADVAWDFAAAMPCLPADLRSLGHLARIFKPRHARLLALQGRSLASLLPAGATTAFRTFLDAQLLITAQGSAAQTDASFGVTALDIAREGTYHLDGGISAIATALARAARRHGAAIRYTTTVQAVRRRRDGRFDVRTSGGAVVARSVVSALPYENLALLLGEPHERGEAQQCWSAVVAYVGVPPGVLDDDIVLHHQVVFDAHAPLGEGNTAFVSISAAADRSRARRGGRAVTISTHTDPALWERAYASGTYDTLREEYGRRLLRALERAAGRPVRPDVFEVGTPHTFERYTARYRGLVGGVPQVPAHANLRARSHRTHYANLVLCGDTIFPGQSTVGVSLSALNAVRALGALSGV